MPCFKLNFQGFFFNSRLHTVFYYLCECNNLNLFQKYDSIFFPYQCYCFCKTHLHFNASCRSCSFSGSCTFVCSSMAVQLMKECHSDFMMSLQKSSNAESALSSVRAVLSQCLRLIFQSWWQLSDSLEFVYTSKQTANIF